MSDALADAMSDVGTLTGAGPADTAGDGRARGPGRDHRRIRRVRSLPGGRAVVGALLVTAAAVGVFASYLDATAEPDTRYVVVTGDLPVGTVLTDELVRDTRTLGLLPLDLPPLLAANSIPAGQALDLVGQVVTAPLVAGDLVSRSALSRSTVDDDVVRVSFAIDPARAVGGAIEPGDRVDVAVTHGSGTDSFTFYVVRAALVADVRVGDGGIGRAAMVLSLALPDDVDVLALISAVETGEVVVTRSSRLGAGHEVPPYTPPASVAEATAVPARTASGSPAVAPADAAPAPGPTGATTGAAGGADADAGGD